MKRERPLGELCTDRRYVTAAGHDGAVPGTITYTLAVPLTTGETLVVQGGDAFLRQVRQWAGVQQTGANAEGREACQRACCLAAPALPGFERLVERAA